MSELKKGDVVQGTVVSAKPFGAFVTLTSGETGLVHISQISSNYVKQVGDVLQVGMEVKAKVLSVEPTGRISLSIKALQAPSSDRPERGGWGGGRGDRGDRGDRGGRRSSKYGSTGNDFEDMMRRFMKSSEERLSTLAAKQKRNR
nr:S1 RNA-binding domain-containing protein [Pasteuria penetrans]